MEEETKDVDNDDVQLVGDESAMEAKVMKLKKALEICRREKEDYLSGWKRAKADYINSEREFAKREGYVVQYAEQNIVRDLLNIIDSFEKALAVKPPGAVEQWAEGIENIHGTLLAFLKSNGVSVIETEGKMFDPNIHEAVEMIPVEREEDDERIVAQLQKGYTMRDRVLRPAKVKVAKFNI